MQIGGQRKVIYGKSRKQAAEKLQAISEQARKAGNRLPSAGQLTLGDYLTEWLAQAESRLRPATLHSYGMLARCHILPPLAAVKLTRLHPLHLVRFYADLAKGGMSARRRQQVHGLLHKTLGDAAKWGLIAVNPAGLVAGPRAETAQPKLWAPEQVSLFLGAMLDGQGRDWGYLFAFLLASGCREGEAFGLSPTDVHWESGTVSIERQVTWVGNRPMELSPKSKAGKRAIALPGWGLEALKRQKAQVAEWRLRQGASWPGHLRLFVGRTGTTPTPGNLRGCLHAICKRLGLPLVRVHDLRHLNLSLLALAGVSVKVAQQRAGHSTAAVTLNIYQHVLGDADKQAAKALENVLKGGVAMRV